MKKLVYCLSVFLFFIGAKAQQPVYDALELSKHLNSDGDIKVNDSVAMGILAKYHPDYNGKDSIPKAKLKKWLDSLPNPFISVSGEALSPSQFNVFDRDFFSQAGKNLMSLPANTVADALATLVVKQFKQEMNETFFVQLKKYIDGQPELNILFPNTVRVLNGINQDIYNFNAYLLQLQKAFQNDLANIYQNLPTFLHDSAFQANLPLSPEAKNMLNAGLQIANLIKTYDNPAEMLDAAKRLNLPDSFFLKGYLQVTSVISSALRGQESVWVHPDDLRRLVRNDAALTIFIGLVWIGAEEIYIHDKKLRDELAKLRTDWQKLVSFKSSLLAIGDEFETLNGTINRLRQMPDKNYEYYYQLYSQTLTTAQTVIHIADTGFKLNMNPKVDLYFDFAQLMGQVYLECNEKEYSAGAADLGNALTVLVGMIKDEDKKDEARDYLTTFMKYVTFIASAAEAENAEDLSTVLEAYTLPSGSSSLKTSSCMNVTINSYFGGFYAIENKTNQNNENFQSFGPTLPIGLNVSWGWNNKYVGAVSLFLPLIDIGAVGAFRLNDDTTQALPAFTFENIVAPGALLVFNRIANTPLSLAGGYQMSPQLRTITGTETQIRQNIWRFQVSLTWDIPLFNLYNKPRKK